MNITQIVIKNLFGVYSYDLDLREKGNLAILTGPNGYGKTTILSIINNLYSNNFYFFQELDFELIQLFWEKDYSIEINKQFPETDISTDSAFAVQDAKVEFVFRKEGIEQSSRFIFDPSQFKTLLEDFSNVRWKGDDTWIDRRNDCFFTTNEILERNPEMLGRIRYKELDGNLSLFLNSLNSYLIKDQRLSSIDTKRYPSYSPIRKREFSISRDAEELAEIIKSKQLEALKESQALDSTFPLRLLEISTSLSAEEYQERYEKLIVEQEKLRKYGLSTTAQLKAPYTPESERTLTIYLNDAEKKTEMFKELVDKLELFTSIVNQKEFANKDLSISTEKGFVFTTKKGKVLKPENLSSGEQHEMILLYDLLFKANPDTVVLIDEPEISLHVEWQQVFIGDLLEIAKLKNLQLIVATHSPQIIGNNWDKCYDLYQNAIEPE